MATFIDNLFIVQSKHVPKEFGENEQLRTLIWKYPTAHVILLTANGVGKFDLDPSLDPVVTDIFFNLNEDLTTVLGLFENTLAMAGLSVENPHKLAPIALLDPALYLYIPNSAKLHIINSVEEFTRLTGHLAMPALQLNPKAWTWKERTTMHHHGDHAHAHTMDDLKEVPHKPNRETVQVEIGETFGILLNPVLDSKGNEVPNPDGGILRKKQMVPAFAQPGPFTPAINPDYKFTRDNLVAMLLAMMQGGRLYLKGHSGTGKTELVRQVAARLNYNLIIINFDGSLMRSDLVGAPEIVSKGGQTFTRMRYGLIPIGLTLPGTIILMDEVDACPPDTAFVLQRVVSEDRRFLMMETNEIFEMHPQNFICATANTNGFGDDTGLYAGGTNVLNFSFLNRFDYTLDVDYLSKEEEFEILSKQFGKDLGDDLLDRVCQIADLIRSAFKNNQVRVPITTRDVLSWCSKMCYKSEVMATAEYSFLNRMCLSDAMQCAQIIQRVMKLSSKESKKYLRNVGTETKVI